MKTQPIGPHSKFDFEHIIQLCLFILNNLIEKIIIFKITTNLLPANGFRERQRLIEKHGNFHILTQ